MDNPTSKTLFVYTADDYGLRLASDPILALVRAGRLNRVAVMIDSCTQEAAHELLKAGVVQIDLHLSLVPLLGRGEISDSGLLSRGFNFLKRLLAGALGRGQVEEEWKRQIDLFRERFGRLPDGLNSHEHVHYFPAFTRVMVELAVKNKIPFIRLGRYGIVIPVVFQPIASILQLLWFWGRCSFASPLETSDYVGSLDWVMATWDRQKWPGGTVELIVHPEITKEYDWLMERK